MNSKEIVQSFITECEAVKMAHDLFSTLFDPGDDRKRKLLQSVAPKTFGDLNETLVGYMLLQFAKLTDPAKTGIHRNLTSNFIVENSTSSAGRLASGHRADPIRLLIGCR